MNLESYFESMFTLDETIDNVVREFSFGEGFSVSRLNTKEKFEAVSNSDVGVDFRANQEGADGLSSVFEGLSFDPENTRVQAYYIETEGKIVAIMTFAIVPKKFIVEQRYIRKKEGGVEICDINSLIGKVPDFNIVPAWTKVDDEYKTKFAIVGFRLIKKVLETLEQKSPQNTCIEVSALGDNRLSKINSKLIKDHKVGDFVLEKDISYSLDEIGVSSEGSRSTVKMAKLLDIPEMTGVGTVSLGPVFIKEVK